MVIIPVQYLFITDCFKCVYFTPAHFEPKIRLFSFLIFKICIITQKGLQTKHFNHQDQLCAQGVLVRGDSEFNLRVGLVQFKKNQKMEQSFGCATSISSNEKNIFSLGPKK